MEGELEEQLLAILEGEANIDAEVDQELYPQPDWAVGQVVRASGLVEDICEHGIGHPNAGWMKLHDPDGELGWGIHGCDLCCFSEEAKARIRRDIEERKNERRVD